MSAYLPVTLNGSNLRERHQYLNSLVTKAYEENVSIYDIITLPENTSIDRIFKIDLASKYKYIEYILQNLKDDDMLFVSRALKCHWLLEPKYCDVISPLYLEDVLYPEMIQPAVNKMKHWLRLNLKNSERCQEFYNFYKSNMDEAINFFWHSSNEFILSELPNIIDKLTPVQVKLLFEICPPACALYFKILPNNRTALSRYVNDECNYFKCVKYLMKHDGNSFLDIVEKYFNTSKLEPFGPASTEFIMKHYKSRVLAKIELYASSLLNIKTLAAYLSSDEANDIILQLARAHYLASWFSYQKVEPLFKRLSIKERTTLKKQIFVDKTVGDKVAEWPYSLPTPLILEEDYYLLDRMKPVSIGCGLKKFLKKRKYKRYSCEIVSMEKSQLQKLFNRYRFTGFEATFCELSKKLLAEGTIEGRLNMMLVLVSKSGGVTEQVEKLLRFLVERHKNEPNTLRAAVIRSLVKRERVWCVQDQAWDYLLEFGRDIGLDGSTTELICREGLHAVIIRHLLNDISIPEYLLSGFIREFSTLSEYKLNIKEKALITKRLPLQLLTLSPVAFLDVLGEYKISIKEFPDAVPILTKTATVEPDLVSRLYKGKMLRRELFHENFRLKPTDAMYLNALRYDIKPLENGKSFAILASAQRTNHDRFLKSLSVYFSESGGLAEQHRLLLEEALERDPKPWLVRPMCTLMTNQSLFRRISESSCETKSENNIKSKILLSEFKSNAHKTKPTLDIDVIDWRIVGVKAIANKVFICRTKDQERYLMKLVEWRRTAKILLKLSSKTPFAVDYFVRVCTLRPSVALNFGLSSYLTKITIDESIWNALKSLIKNTKNISDKRDLLKKLEHPNSVPKNIEGDYWAFVYNIFLKIDKSKTTVMVYHLENILPEVDRNVITDILKEFIDDLSVGKLVNIYDDNERRSLYFRIIAKHLLLCKSEEEQKYLNENICDRFFDVLEVLFKTEDNKAIISESLDEFILSLKYTKVFIDEHVSSMTVFKRVLNRLHKILPIEENFRKYAEIHLTMLFYKSIKQMNKFELNITDSKKRYEAIKVLGKLFGKYIGYEIKELISRYFRSVLDMYKSILYNYFDNYFVYNYARKLFVTFVIKGILEAGTNEAFLLAEHIFQRNQKYYISEPHRSEILNVLNESSGEVKLFLYNNVFNP